MGTLASKEEEGEEEENKSEMASVPSSSPRPAPLPASDSANSIPHSPNNQVESATNNGVFIADEKKPEVADGLLDHLDSTQCIERFRKYDTEYTRRLLAKYFSTKSLYGGNIFDEQITIGDETIKSSRLPCLRSYADPVVGFEDQCSNGSSSPADTQASIPNGKHMVKKN